MTKGKKILIIVLSIIAFIILIGLIIVFIATKDLRNHYKLLNHLENIGYTCDNKNKIFDTKICTRKDSKTKEQLTIDANLNSVWYQVDFDEYYHMSISNGKYKKGYTGAKSISIYDKDEERNICYYIPKDYDGDYTEFDHEDKWEVGDKSAGYTFGYNSKGSYGVVDCPYNFNKKVDAMLREFESYYEYIGMKLGE